MTNDNQLRQEPQHTPANATAGGDYRLPPEQVTQFHRDGWLGPFTLMSPAEMAPLRSRIEQEVLSQPSAFPVNERQSRHLDRRVIWDLCSHPGIVERIACILGPDLQLWRSHLYVKGPGTAEIPWHQDFQYWPIEPALAVSAWLAIDKVTLENACMSIIPGSHKLSVPHIPSPPEYMFPVYAEPTIVERALAENGAQPIEVEPGQFILFNERLVHRSPPNNSQDRRLVLTVRVTVPLVRVDHDQLFPGHRCIQLRGQDPLGFNLLTTPPQ